MDLRFSANPCPKTLDESREFEDQGRLSYFIELPNIRIFVRYIAEKISHSSVSDFLLALALNILV